MPETNIRRLQCDNIDCGKVVYDEKGMTPIFGADWIFLDELQAHSFDFSGHNLDMKGAYCSKACAMKVIDFEIGTVL